MIWPFKSRRKETTEARKRALEAVRKAILRGDTRAMHEALETARQATTAQLRMELKL